MGSGAASFPRAGRRSRLEARSRRGAARGSGYSAVGRGSLWERSTRAASPSGAPAPTPLPSPAAPDSPDPAATGGLSPQQKLAVDLGPLVVFFGTYLVAKRSLGDTEGLIWATGVFVVATAIALAYSFSIERKLQTMPLVTGVVVLVMGGLTVYFNDERFIKYKPTIVSSLMGSTLLGGLLTGRSLIRPLLGSTLELDDEGWRKLTLRWGLFFLMIAGLNELVWRTTSTTVWLNFKLFGILGLTFLFMLLQQPLLQRHGVNAEGSPRQD